MLNSPLNDCHAFAQTEEIASSFSRDPPPGSASGDWRMYPPSFLWRVCGGVNFLDFSNVQEVKKEKPLPLKNLSHPHDGAKIRMIRSTS